MKHFTIDTAPPMSNGLMIAALSGPQDVAQSATIALKHLMQRDEAVTFAQADPDGLFIYNIFTPNLKREQESGLVTIMWPQLELHHAGPGDEPGPVFLTGWRPQIGMHGLIDDLGEIAEMCGIRNMIHLTSGYGEQLHTRRTIISTLATAPHENPELYEIMTSVGAEPNAVPLDPVLVQAADAQGKARSYASLVKASYPPQLASPSPAALAARMVSCPLAPPQRTRLTVSRRKWAAPRAVLARPSRRRAISTSPVPAATASSG